MNSKTIILGTEPVIGQRYWVTIQGPLTIQEKLMTFLGNTPDGEPQWEYLSGNVAMPQNVRGFRPLTKAEEK